VYTRLIPYPKRHISYSLTHSLTHSLAPLCNTIAHASPSKNRTSEVFGDSSPEHTPMCSHTASSANEDAMEVGMYSYIHTYTYIHTFMFTRDVIIDNPLLFLFDKAPPKRLFTSGLRHRWRSARIAPPRVHTYIYIHTQSHTFTTYVYLC